VEVDEEERDREAVPERVREAAGLQDLDGAGEPRIQRADVAEQQAHPTRLPADGATTIVVSSGLLADPDQMLAVAVGVGLLTVACWLLNRAIGVPALAWAARA
jgi:hypothetical protein